MFRWAMLVGMDRRDLDASMYLQVALTQAVRRFGGVNVPPGRGQRRGPRGFHTPYSPGPARRQGPGRFGHVNVDEAGGWRAMARTPVCDCVRVRVLDVRVRVLGFSAVWPWVSGRMASGLSPRGVSSFVHARLGVRGNQGRMVSNLPSLCPHTCSRPPVVPHVPSPRGVAIAFLAGFHGAVSPLVVSG